MNRLLTLCAFILITACSQRSTNNAIKNEPVRVIDENYELTLPQKQNGFLILFPCFPCDAEHTKTEFAIEDIAIENNIAVLFMNFNQHLWLSKAEKKELENIIVDAVNKNKIDTKNTYIGGFSSGGNTSLLLSNYLKKSNSSIQPKGVFIVDAPIDLLGLYENAKEDIEKGYSEIAVEEAKWIVNTFDSEFGKGDTGFINYEIKSPYTSKTHSLKNLSNLQDVSIRFYSEPDTTWWKENRNTNYEQTNAYYIEQLAKDLNKLNGQHSVTSIRTENKGFRSNGERHPHSWSIIDKMDLINWILE